MSSNNSRENASEIVLFRAPDIALGEDPDEYEEEERKIAPDGGNDYFVAKT